MNQLDFHTFLEELDRNSPQSGIAAQAVRDLAWLLFAPDTLDATHPSVEAFVRSEAWVARFEARWRERLVRLSADPSALVAAVNPPPRRLGLYAERLLAWWLEHEPELDIVLRHQPVVQDKRTVGDFDFVVADARAGTIHIELAVKFFLGIGEARTLDHWVGSSLEDSLDIKWRKATRQQLRLGRHPAARAVLAAPPDHCWFWLKAWLFYPLHAAVEPAAPITPEHSRGIWGGRDALLDRWGARADCWPLRLLQRLAPARFDADFKPERLDAVLRRWSGETDGYPILIARMEPHPLGGWIEIERAYAVSDEWPIRATEWSLSS